VQDITVDAWKTYSIPVSDFVANPLPGGNGVDLSNVVNPFVIEPANATAANISADIYLDNIRLAFACAGNRNCQPQPMLKGGGGVLRVFGDMLNTSVWTEGLSAFDQALSFSSCTNDGGAGCPSISWNIVDAAVDTTRGKVIEVTYSGTQFAGLVIGGPQTTGIDLSSYAGGNLVFDVLVTANPNSVPLRAKVDCTGCPTDSGQREQDLGTPALDTWTEISIPIDDMVNTAGGLQLNMVTTGLVIFAPFGMTEGVSFQVDNVRWEGGSSTTTPPTTIPTGTGAVYADALDDQWSEGLSAFDQAISYSSCTADGGAGCPSIGWTETAAADTTRGQVIEVTYPSDAMYAGLVVGLESAGLDMSAFAGGRIVFDLNVTANPSNANFTMKVDCTGCPNAGQGEREQSLGLPGSGWTSYTVNVDDIVGHSGGPTAGGLKLGVVTTGMVLFPAFGMTAGVEYQLDNVRWEAAGTTTPPPTGTATGGVYADAVDTQWVSSKLSAFDQAIGYGSCVDDLGAGCPSIAWTEEDVTNRGKVIEVTYSGTQFAGLIVGRAGRGLDLSAFAGGTLQFDLNVTANPNNVAFRVKVDCDTCPSDAGEREQSIGVPGTGWNGYGVNIDDMVNANGGPTSGGLKLNVVQTGLVIFPPFGMTEGVVYQLDNVRWVKSSP
ncbi:MAG: hypothetical protein ACR2PJ_07060, partial [Pseudomonadales bacterium]